MIDQLVTKNGEKFCQIWRIPWSIEALAKSHKTQKMAYVKLQNNDI